MTHWSVLIRRRFGIRQLDANKLAPAWNHLHATKFGSSELIAWVSWWGSSSCLRASRVSGMRTYTEAVELAVMSARCARSASTKRVAQELWDEAAKLNGGTPPDLGDPPRGLEG